MKIFETGGNDGGVEARLVSGKGFHVTEVCEELTSVNKLEDEIKVSGVLSESFETDDEGVGDL